VQNSAADRGLIVRAQTPSMSELAPREQVNCSKAATCNVVASS